MVIDGLPPPAETLISQSDLRTRVPQLAGEISAHYSDSVPILISVLKGSALFLADLARAIAIEVEIDFMSISSYQSSGAQSGVVKIVKDLESDISGRDVLIVEDIVDTGLTLNYLRRTLEEREPASLRAVTLLDKSARRIVPVPLEWSGFEIPDVFVVGYGLDFQGRYRNVPDLLAVKDLARLANNPLLLVPTLFEAV
ncbi:MAG: hypoxanthine phosphoribosyltransferase [Actinomycetota bacterium]|nr:hypoxanthine phosphoribosyltransferase [Actinomycetota bacterium]